jgi:hypothetical protein
MKSDAMLVMAAVTSDGMALRFAADHLRSDPNIVLVAVTQNANALQVDSH